MINNEFNIAVYIPTFDDFPEEGEASIESVISTLSEDVFDSIEFTDFSDEITFTATLSMVGEEGEYEEEGEMVAFQVEDYSSDIEIQVSESENSSEFGEQNLGMIDLEEKDFGLNFYVLFEKANLYAQSNQWVREDNLRIYDDLFTSKAAEVYQTLDVPAFFDKDKKPLKKRFKEIGKKKEKHTKIISHK